MARKLEESRKLFDAGVLEGFKADIANRPAPLSLKKALDSCPGTAIIGK